MVLTDARLHYRVKEYISSQITEPLIAKKIEMALSEPGKVLALPQSAIFSWSGTMLKIASLSGKQLKANLPIAIALDLFTTAADIFDDIADQDNFTAVWSQYSKGEQLSLAILLWQLANNLVSQLFPLKTRRVARAYFSKAATASCLGQYKDVMLYKPTSLDDCLNTVIQKSGSLMALCCALGGLSFNIPEDKFWQIGETFGIIGQLQNDVKAILEPCEKSDISFRKITLPVAFCLFKPGGRHQVLENFFFYQNTVCEAQEISALVVDQGGIVYTAAVIDQFRQVLAKQIYALPVDTGVKNQLAELFTVEEFSF